jgi:ABC-type lipoprotein export system ATPase subunit
MTVGPGRREAGAEPITQPPMVIECMGVGRTFGSGRTAVHAIRDASCRIPSSARIALTGPSGSGKSTLLTILAGLDAPTSGEVRWPALQRDRQGRPKGIGVVFQGPSLLPALDVTENVALPLILDGQTDDVAMRCASAALDLVGICELGGKLPDELSAGQSQRVAIARVVAARPSVILADEPTGQLDHDNGDHVMSVLSETATNVGAALIVATHDDAVAARLAVRWTMHDGLLHTPPDDHGTT